MPHLLVPRCHRPIPSSVKRIKLIKLLKSTHKLRLFLLASSLLAIGQTLAQTTWTGTNNGDWNNPSNWTTGAINFTNDNFAQIAVFTLGTLGQSITPGGNITSSISGSAPANAGITDTIDLDLILDASRAITTNASGMRSHNLNILGVSSQSTSGLILTKAGGVPQHLNGILTITE